MKKYILTLLTLAMLLSLTACGDQEATNTAADISGYYPVSGATIDGDSLSLADLESMDMAENVYLQLNPDGTGELSFGNDNSDSITYDEMAGTLTYDNGTTFPFTVEGGTITVVFESEEDNDMTMCYTRARDASAAISANGASGASTFDLGSVTVAGSMNDAFSGYAASGFISPTTSMTLGNLWFGTMIITDSVGNSTGDCEKDIIAMLDETKDGRKYFEVFTDSSMESEYLKLSLYIDLHDDGFDADIGDKDAWVLERYLEEEDAVYFSPKLKNGALDMSYAYVHPDDGSTCNIRFFLREDGTPWNEADDPLPPSYEEYKASLDNEY